MIKLYGSVCSGISADAVAWHPLGWKTAFFSEIEEFPCALLNQLYPDVPNLGDMNLILPGGKLDGREPIDLFIGGTPCQSFSIAGLRKGLDDPRGNLALVFLSILDRLRPRWVVWENVPGVLSSWTDAEEGEGGSKWQTNDFDTFTGALEQLGYGYAYRVLDAQFFGVPQRRRRVFVVGYLGNWRYPAAVLFERHCMWGNHTTSAKAGQAVAALTASGSGVGGPDAANALAGHMISSPLLAREAKGPSSDVDGTPLVIAFSQKDHGADAGELAPTLRAMGHHKSHANGGGQIAILEQREVAHTLRAEGFDGAEDGSGRGTPLVFDTNQITHRENRSNPKPGDPSPSLSATGAAAPAIIERPIHFADVSDPLCANEQRTYTHEGKGNFRLRNTVGYSTGVRRLTPRECERLQGFPDDYTAILFKDWLVADGHRYKALGNSMAVPVVHWLGRRIEMVEALIGNPNQNR